MNQKGTQMLSFKRSDLAWIFDLATLIAVHLGFIALVLFAAVLYGVAAVVFPVSSRGTAPWP